MQARRHLGLGLLLVGILAAITYGFWPQPVAVDVATVKRGDLMVSVEEEGRSRVIDRFVVSAPVSGNLQRIKWVVGDPVRKGEVLAVLTPRSSDVLDARSRAEAQARVSLTEAAYRAAQSAADAARAEADIARTAYRRLQGLGAKKLVSEEDLDRARVAMRAADANYRTAQFNIEVANFEWQAAQTALSYSAAEAGVNNPEQVKLIAPVDGRILALHRESEGIVAAGAALLELGDPAALEVAVDVLSEDAVRIEQGTEVILERWGGNLSLAGRVKRIEPTGFTKVSALGVEEQRVWVIVDIIDPYARWSRLGDGYRLEARFVLWRGENVLLIPTSTLFRYADGWAVFAVDAGRAIRTSVGIGQRTGLFTEVIDGLREGQQLINYPDEDVHEGIRVRMVE